MAYGARRRRFVEGDYERSNASNSPTADEPGAVKKVSRGFVRAESLDRPIDYGTAYQLLSEALAAQPNDPVAVYNRAMASERLANYQSAIQD